MSGFETAAAVLDAYAEGSRALDRALLARCFHPAATMAGDLAGRLLVGGPEPFLADVAALRDAGVDHRGVMVAIADLAERGAIASATVRTQGFGGRYDFEDRLHLLRDEEGWRITAKLFTTL